MLLSQKRLTVIVNPFAAELDQHGRPCAHVLYDPAHSGGSAQYIGAQLNRVVVEKRSFSYAPGAKQVIAGGGQQDRVDLSFSYDLEPVQIEDTKYHRKMIADGALVAVDARTAKAASVEFIDPKTVIAKDRERRIADWKAQHGEEPKTGEWKISSAPNAKKAGDA
jgi:hypothetical protein